MGDGAPQPRRGRRVEIAGWRVANGRLLPSLADAFALHHDALDPQATLPPDGRRATFEARVGNRLATFEPPSTFLTVAGRELRRYADAVHLHPIPDLYPIPGRDGVLPGAHEAVVMNDVAFAVPIAVWGVNRWCFRTDIVERADVDVEDLDDPDAFAQALDRIEERTDAVGAAICRDGAVRLALLCECLIGRHGPAILDDLETGTVSGEPLAAAARTVATLIGPRDRETADPETAATRLADGDAAFTRATPRRIARLSLAEAERVETFHFPGTTDLFLLDVLAMPYPKRNPSPVATERFLTFLQASEVGRLVGAVPGLLPASVATWDELAGDFAAAHRRDYHRATDVVLAPSTGCAMEPSVRWRAIAELAALPARVTPTAVYESASALRA